MPIWYLPSPSDTDDEPGDPAVEVEDGALDLVAIALDRLPQQFRDLESWITTITVLVTPFQRIENTLADMLVMRRLSTARGANLDRIGKIVKEARNGEPDDEVYRRRIRARIKQKRSRGTTEDIIDIARLLIFDEDAGIVVHQLGTAAAVVVIEGVTVDAALGALLTSFLTAAVPAGVRLLVESSAVAAAATFSFARTAFVDTPLAGGGIEAAIVVTEGYALRFPATGYLLLDAGLATEETVEYSARTHDTFTLAPATFVAHAHGAGAAVTLSRPGDTRGFDDYATPGVGGEFATVRG